MEKYNKEAAKKYAEKATNIQQLLKEIGEVGLIGCREANWAHVGSLAHAEEGLQDILNFLTNKES